MDDLISRQQAIAMCRKPCMRNADCSDFEMEIMLLPSAQPEIIHCEDCKYGMLDPSFPHQWFCKFKGDEWNNGDYFCGHARKSEVTT